jgi:hypothetical protein
MPIIRSSRLYHCSPHGTSDSGVLMVVRCGLAGYVAGLAVTASESDVPCAEQWYSRELLMMSIEVPETC